MGARAARSLLRAAFVRQGFIRAAIEVLLKIRALLSSPLSEEVLTVTGVAEEEGDFLSDGCIAMIPASLVQFKLAAYALRTYHLITKSVTSRAIRVLSMKINH